LGAWCQNLKIDNPLLGREKMEVEKKRDAFPEALYGQPPEAKRGEKVV